MIKEIIIMVKKIVNLFFTKISPFSFEGLTLILLFLVLSSIPEIQYKKIMSTEKEKEKDKDKEKEKEKIQLLNAIIRMVSLFWSIVCIVYFYKGNITVKIASLAGMYISQDAFGIDDIKTKNFRAMHRLLVIILVIGIIAKGLGISLKRI